MEENWVENEEWQFVYERVQALQDFFDAIDSLSKGCHQAGKPGIVEC